MTSLPSRQIGVIRDENGEGHLKTFPVPEPGPNEVLTENVAVASNPIIRTLEETMFRGLSLGSGTRGCVYEDAYKAE